MAEPLRVLLVGCGGITHGHLPAFETLPERFRLVAACDPSERARSAVAERIEAHGKIQMFADHRDALDATAGQVDAALVVTPHCLHFPQASDCLRAGLHVLIEKPICNNFAEALQLHHLAEESGLVCMAGQTRRYHRWSRQLKDWVAADAGNFGELASFSIEAWQNILCWIATKPDKTADFWILDKDRAGGGVVVSLGCHTLDIIRYLSGSDYTEVSAFGIFNPPFKNGAESACSATLRMGNGAVGTLHANYLAKRVPYSETFKMYGTRGSIVQHATKWGSYEGEVRYGTAVDDDPYGWEFQYEGLDPLPQVDIPGYEHNLFINQLKHFRDCVLNNREPLTSVRDNLNTMAVIDAIYTSIKEGGRTVPVPTA